LKNIIMCKECLTVFTIDNINPLPKLVQPRVCVFCCSPNISSKRSPQVDFLTEIASELELPKDIVQIIYNMWNPTVDGNLREYILNTMKEAISVKVS